MAVQPNIFLNEYLDPIQESGEGSFNYNPRMEEYEDIANLGIVKQLFDKARRGYEQVDKNVFGGILPGGVSVQQHANFLRNPSKQLANPEAYRAWQQNRIPREQYNSGSLVSVPGGSFNVEEATELLRNPYTKTSVSLTNTPKGAVEVHFMGPELNESRAEARRQWLLKWNDRPEDLFGRTDRNAERIRGLALRAQLGAALDSLPPGTAVTTGAKESPYNSRAKIYDRMTKGAFAVDPATGQINVYKASPTAWINNANPENTVTFNPRELIKPLEREAFRKPDINSFRETPGGTVVETLARRFGGPYVQTGLFLDDAIQKLTGVSPVDAVVSASEKQLTETEAQKQKINARFSPPWQTPPF